MTKAALNALTVRLAREAGAGRQGQQRRARAGCGPAWAAAGADRTVEQGADTGVWLATLADDGPTGGFFRDRAPTDW